VAKATSLVKQAAAQTGAPVSLTLNHVPDASTTRIAEYLQQQLQAVGLQVTLAPIQQADIINTALLGKFQAQVWRQFGAIDPDMNYIFWSPTNANTPVFSINMARNTDPAMEIALLKGRQSPAPAERAAAYREVSTLLARDIPYVWADRSTWAFAAHASVENFNHPTTPAGGRAFGQIGGSIWPTQIWLNS
jgi:peptide/nickel transport system substrate-binding protein